MRWSQFRQDNKQSLLFAVCFILLSVTLVLVSVTKVKSNYEYKNGVMHARIEAKGLRDNMKAEMIRNQEVRDLVEQRKTQLEYHRSEFAKQQALLEIYSGSIATLQNKLHSLEETIQREKARENLRKEESTITPAAANKINTEQKMHVSREDLLQKVKGHDNKFKTPDFPQAKPFELPPKSTISSSKPDLSQAVTPEQRREAVKTEFLHAWNNYKEFAWGEDELKPVSKSSGNWLDLGITIVDSLDTLWIMDLKEEFTLARDWVAEHLDFNKDKTISVFETTIRELGGLLSAFEFSRDAMFLDKAEDLAYRLLASFTEDNVMPNSAVSLNKNNVPSVSWSRTAVLSELGSLQLEFLYLAYHTGNIEFAIKPLNIFKHLDSTSPAIPGLYPLHIPLNGDINNAAPEYSLGALGDSFYEYELKLWLLTDKQCDGYRRMYEQSSEAIIDKLVGKSPSGLTYVTQLKHGRQENTMEHLTCFSGGMFALGAHTGSVKDTAEHLALGANITETCHESYKQMPTGIGPESFTVGGARFQSRASYYILRPGILILIYCIVLFVVTTIIEVVESYFILWRLTKDNKYREWAWEAFSAIVQNCRVEHGYSGIHNVNSRNVSHDDNMQSFFLAETLKYLYLIFCDDDVVPLDSYVFNTEAHPLGKLRDISSWPSEVKDVLLMS